MHSQSSTTKKQHQKQGDENGPIKRAYHQQACEKVMQGNANQINNSILAGKILQEVRPCMWSNTLHHIRSPQALPGVTSEHRANKLSSVQYTHKCDPNH